MNVETNETEHNHSAHMATQIAPHSPQPSIERRLATSKVDVWTRPYRQQLRRPICKSELD